MQDVQIAINEWSSVEKAMPKPSPVYVATMKNCKHSRKEKNKHGQNKATKRDVNKYLKKQDDGFANTALADALAKLKDK